MIKAELLVKTFPKRWIPYRPQPVDVLKGINFHAEPGTITGIMGKNGAGKTTLFRIISGIEPLTSGHLWVNGQDMLHAESAKRIRGQVALLPEEPGLSGLDTAEYHLHLFGVMMGLSYKETHYQLDKLNERLKLTSYWKRPYRDYSKGQKAKISLARMLMMKDANILIFDEPTNGLDFETAGVVRDLIRETAQKGKTVLLASHIVSEMILLCDTIVGIEDGKIVEDGPLFNDLNQHVDLYREQIEKYKRPELKK